MVKISLPLSATALRHGSDLLLELAADAEVIRAEMTPRPYWAVTDGPEPDSSSCSVEAECPAKFDNVLNFGKDPLMATAGAETVSPDDTELLQTGEPVIPAEFLINYPASGLPSPVLNVVEVQLHTGELCDSPPVEEMEDNILKYEGELTLPIGAFDAPPAAPAAPVFDLQMTDKAGAWSLAEFREQGWTDDNLIEAGYAERVARPFTSAPAPAIPSAPLAPDIAPSVSSSNGASSIASVELDKNGLPWDARIHSGAANKLTAEGRWKRKRGVAEELVTQVEAELRAVMAVPAPSPIAQAANQMSALSATLAPVPPAAVPAPNNVPDGYPATFPALTLWLSGHLNGGRIAQADVALAVQSTGLSLLPDLNKRPDLIPAVVEHLCRNRGL